MEGGRVARPFFLRHPHLHRPPYEAPPACLTVPDRITVLFTCGLPR
jgi:hypothetical protein